MRSKAQVRGHPIHPMLIVFPAAFLPGALACDLFGGFAGRGYESWWTTGAYLGLAGIATGLVAAVPGLIDYVKVVPPRSSAKVRATKHMAVNLTALAAFAVGWLLRGRASTQPDGWIVMAEVVGVGLLVYGGWMGGTLVYRNQIGVDHRYARAGKWAERRVEARPGEPVAVAGCDELELDQMKLIRLSDGRRVVLARTEARYAAVADRCPHKGGSLAGGLMACGTLTCPWHGSQFDVNTGKLKAGPAEEGIASYHVAEAGGEVRLIV